MTIAPTLPLQGGFSWEIPVARPTTEAARSVERKSIFASFAEWIRLPTPTTYAAPSVQRQAHELVALTGLSRRLLGEIVGVTHPTYTAILSGNSTTLSKRPEVAPRLDALYSLASRLAVFEHQRPGAMASALLTPIGDGRRIADAAVAGDLTFAYMKALQLLAPRAPRAGRHTAATRSVGTATVGLSD